MKMTVEEGVYHVCADVTKADSELGEDDDRQDAADHGLDADAKKEIDGRYSLNGLQRKRDWTDDPDGVRITHAIHPQPEGISSSHSFQIQRSS